MGRIQRTKVFKLVAVLLVIVMIITSIPVGVYKETPYVPIPEGGVKISSHH